ncbi:hypothetical protein [Anaeromyxobacter paludicola]|uniref:DUF4440 domain-containing protein n=1 Tax=Anaeromyxobacter paludicola TaxID=2918171 RepID=A0ABN6N8G6_9BACT|nr:hypothetical protein [Anaeromyxobacter paludicola]BDG08845.1 hypothetical protein AMPC_19580 [Anaeromyxobacter paludicola]
MSRGRAAAALALSAALLAGCDRERALAERQVRAYDAALVAAYASDDFHGLAEAAGEVEQGRVRALVDRKRRAGYRLEARLEALEVEQVARPGPGALQVTARERWRYHERPTRPNLAPKPEIKAVIALAYELRQEDGRWRVEGGRATSTVYDGQRPTPARLEDHAAGMSEAPTPPERAPSPAPRE